MSAAEGLLSCFNCSGSGSGVACVPVSDDPYACEGYRLPTEAEWEYAARAGESAAYHNGGQLFPGDEETCDGDLLLTNGETLDAIAWYCSGDNTTHSVGSLDPNAWGLYDVSGNVMEWSWDWYVAFDKGSTTDPSGPETGKERSIRGGCFWYEPSRVRSAHRASWPPNDHRNELGFRLARSLPGTASARP